MLKPVNPVELRTTVEIALYKHQLEQARAEKAELESDNRRRSSEMRHAVHENNESFRMMIEAVKDYAILMLDADGRIASWNFGAERLKGYSKQEIIGQHFSKFYTADDIAAISRSSTWKSPQRRGQDRRSWDGGSARTARNSLPMSSSRRCTTPMDSCGDLRRSRRMSPRARTPSAGCTKPHRCCARCSTPPRRPPSSPPIRVSAIKVFNAGAERLLGYASEEVVGCAMPLLLHDPEEIRVCGEELGAQLGRSIEGGQIFQVPSMHGRSREWNYLRKDGGRVRGGSGGDTHANL
jgi:PAS domain S-box-containing protein